MSCTITPLSYKTRDIPLFTEHKLNLISIFTLIQNQIKFKDEDTWTLSFISKCENKMRVKWVRVAKRWLRVRISLVSFWVWACHSWFFKCDLSILCGFQAIAHKNMGFIYLMPTEGWLQSESVIVGFSSMVYPFCMIFRLLHRKREIYLPNAHWIDDIWTMVQHM